MTAEVIPFPGFYRVAFSDGERTEYVAGCQFRNYWEAEHAIHQLQQQYPGLLFWISLPLG